MSFGSRSMLSSPEVGQERPANEVPGDTATLPEEPGRQSLVTIPSMSTGLTALPERGCENLLVVSPWAPDRIESALRDRGVPVGNCGLIPVNGSPVRYDGPLWTTEAVSPADLTGLSMRYCEAMRHVEPGEGWVLIDNVQVLLMYVDADRAVRLLRRLTRQAHERDVTGVVSVDRSAVETRTIATLGQLVGTVVER
ncbi:DUF7504 family protein [Halolamina sediminis]|uniref:DUF7504 family protein n=1 Tax=Halolamina sediminis TaxID=1480675 RepID=UPI0006B640A4|nr:hypothetical protein [Halolamina sediminis]